MAQWLMNLTSIHEVSGFRSLASLSGLRIRRCCELWCRPIAAAPTGPLAWELPYGTCAALKKIKNLKIKKKDQ